MFQEAASGSEAVRAQLQGDAHAIAAIGAELRRLAPRSVITCARGSSDHAATFAKYLIETQTGVVTASAAPSVSSLYRVSQDLRGCLFLAISQSGRSPDLLAAVAAAKQAGATVLALCNSPGAPLSAAADLVIELRAGLETSVAATKSYLATLAALARLVAAWTQDAELQSAIDRLPDLMDQSWALDWSAALAPLEPARNLYVIGRGLGLGAAQETALKFKETCGLHAEAFSSAEVRHGPYALLGAEFLRKKLLNYRAYTGFIEQVKQFVRARRAPKIILFRDARIIRAVRNVTELQVICSSGESRKSCMDSKANNFRICRACAVGCEYIFCMLTLPFAGRQRHHGARGSIGIMVAVGVIGVKQKDWVTLPLLECLVEGHAGEFMIRMSVKSWIGHHHNPRVHLAQHLNQILHQMLPGVAARCARYQFAQVGAPIERHIGICTIDFGNRLLGCQIHRIQSSHRSNRDWRCAPEEYCPATE
jgi:glutamine---fructose-6-phosphate transaminase (isomerizing)